MSSVTVEVIIVDEFTGRLMFGRRYNEGLHQAIEAKEGVRSSARARRWQRLRSRTTSVMYGKLSGMTGTALTEEEEFREMYKLDVIEIPTNKPVARKDNPDARLQERTRQDHRRSHCHALSECHAKGSADSGRHGFHRKSPRS